MQTALSLLNTVFGYNEFRGNQAEVIEQVINGGDALVLMPTGGGKSLCYQIPALVREGVGIVISPLIALMQDQVEALQQLGVKATFLNSSLESKTAWQIEQGIIAGKYDLVYVAPERLLTSRFMQLLEQIPIALFAIDEAHCVSQWGHDFRPEYTQLSILHEKFPKVPRIALTATADDPTREEIITQLKLEQAKKFISSFDRPNIRYRITTKQHSRDQLLEFLSNEQTGNAGIIYCLSRKRVDELAAWLSEKGWPALPYHAGLSNAQRQQHQQRFLREEGCIMVATIAFGMGIDKSNVRFVAHMDLPKSIENYYQETGRAGRDGLPAEAWLIYGLNDIVTLRSMVDSSEANEQRKRLERRKLDALLGFCETTICRRQALLRYFGEQYPDSCQQCDNCLNPVATWDGKIAAQKALSCVYRTEQIFGVRHLIDVLLGKDTPKIQQFHHNKLSTYGIGKEYDASEWHSIFRQLIAANYLTVDISGFGSIKLTPKSNEILRGTQTIAFRQESEKKKKKIKASKAAGNPNTPQDALWEALKEKRLQLARAQSVPPYIIFHDSTLMEIHVQQPKTLEDFAKISGVGQNKLHRYGQAFIDIVNNVESTTH